MKASGGVALAARQRLLLSDGPSMKCRCEVYSVHAVMLSKSAGIPGRRSLSSSADSTPSLSAVPPHCCCVDHHGRIKASLRRVEAGPGHTRPHYYFTTVVPPSICTNTTRLFSVLYPVSKGRPDCMSGLAGPSLYMSASRCRVGRIIDARANTLPNAWPQCLL